MEQVQSAWDEGTPLPSKPVVLTFDDGYRGQLDNAMPVMKRHGWPGVLYMTIANFKPATGLKPADVRELLAAKWELGAHTFSHSDLRTLAPPELRHEVGESRTWLRKRFGRPVKSFAYPAGMYGPAALEEVRRAGFDNAVTVQPGLAERDQPFELNRIRVSANTSPGEHVREIEQLGWN
jgi:peptidoglycan/xylan/chitin deacetylase (PgdA/CDA1 family)